MAARKHHPQHAVPNRARLELLLYRGSQRPLAFNPSPHFRSECAGRPLPAHRVQRAVLRRRHQPRRRILRQSAHLPRFHRAAEGVLHNVFRQRKVLYPEDPRERRHHSSRLAAKQLISAQLIRA
jgi:hypothetical protein